MAYAIMHFFAGGTKEQYEASIAAVRHPSRSTLPKGQSFTRRVRLPADGKLWRFTILRKAGSAFATARFYPKCRKGFRAGSRVLPQRAASRFTTCRNRRGAPSSCK